jgi:hypothetical protein
MKNEHTVKLSDKQLADLNAGVAVTVTIEPERKVFEPMRGPWKVIVG